MNETFNVKVNDETSFYLTPEQARSLDLAAENESKFHVLKDHKAFRVELVSSNFNEKTYSIRVNSNTYRVKLNSALDQLIKEMGFTLGSSKKLNLVKAPMPGIILDLHVAEGQEVKEGDALLILEAMKMENVILSPKDGTVKSIHIENKETVEKGKLLIELH